MQEGNSTDKGQFFVEALVAAKTVKPDVIVDYLTKMLGENTTVEEKRGMAFKTLTLFLREGLFKEGVKFREAFMKEHPSIGQLFGGSRELDAFMVKSLNVLSKREEVDKLLKDVYSMGLSPFQVWPITQFISVCIL